MGGPYEMGTPLIERACEWLSFSAKDVIVEAPFLAIARSSVNGRHQSLPDEPWIENPVGRLRDGSTFNEVKVLLREGHDYVADTT